MFPVYIFLCISLLYIMLIVFNLQGNKNLNKNPEHQKLTTNYNRCLCCHFSNAASAPPSSGRIQCHLFLRFSTFSLLMFCLFPEHQNTGTKKMQIFSIPIFYCSFLRTIKFIFSFALLWFWFGELKCVWKFMVASINTWTQNK